MTNRTLIIIGDESAPKLAPITHTFTFTVHQDGSITTYSWGDTANERGWNINQPEDLKAAVQSLQEGNSTLVAPFVMNGFYREAFDLLNNPANEHMNGILFDNCKTETTKLGKLAWKLAFPDFKP